MPKVSICIPTYNAAPYIEEAVRSVLAQTYRDFELLISDNGSTDGTDALLTRLAAGDPRIRYERNETNLGSGPNFNKLLAWASGDYINVFHADDVMLPRNIEAKVEILDQYPTVGLAASSTLSIGPDGTPLEDNWEYHDDLILPARKWLLEHLGGSSMLCGSFAFLRRSVLEQVGPFNLDYSYAGDFDMWLRFSLVSDTVLMKELLGYYRRHPGSDSHRLNETVRFHDGCGLWSGLLDALALPSDELKQAEAKVAASLFETVYNHIQAGNLDGAAEMLPLLERWRGGAAGAPERLLRKLGADLAESQRELRRESLENLRLRADVATKALVIEKLKRGREQPGASGAG